MTGAWSGLLVAALATPLLLLAACAFRPVRARVLDLLPLAPVPGLAAALLAAGAPSISWTLPRLRLTLALDLPGAVLLGTAALLWIGAGVYAAAHQRGQPHSTRFAEFWLLALAGSLGVFFAADLVSFYVLFALASLAPYGLIAHDGTPRARRAALIYVNFAVLGEALLLAGFVLLAAAIPGESLLIGDAVAALPGSATRTVTLICLIAGFGLKAGLVPLHVWLPLAYSAAPIPAAAVISGAISKAGIIGLIRFLPVMAGLPHWGGALTGIGLFAAFYGVAVGVTQANPKTVLAYSSISQMGFIAAVLGRALSAGSAGALLPVAFYAGHHVLAKGSLFLAVGVAARGGARRLWLVLLPAAVVALGFGGLPFTGGGLAKLAVKAPLEGGAVGALATASAVASTVLMLYFLRRLATVAPAAPNGATTASLTVPWLVLAFASVAIPWVLYPALGLGSLTEAFASASLWKALWPVLVGVVLAAGLARWEGALPRVPEGDIVVLGRFGWRAARACGNATERADEFLRRWPIAGLSLLALAVALYAAMMAKG